MKSVLDEIDADSSSEYETQICNSNSWRTSSRCLGGGFMFVCGALFSVIFLGSVVGVSDSRNPEMDMLQILMLMAALSCAVFGFGGTIAAVRNQSTSFRSHGLGFLISLVVFSLPIFLSRVT